jgi:hypothetical protein
MSVELDAIDPATPRGLIKTMIEAPHATQTLCQADREREQISRRRSVAARSKALQLR